MGSTAPTEGEAERLRAILDATADAIVVIDERGAIQMSNASAEKPLGHHEGAVLGRNVAMLARKRGER